VLISIAGFGLTLSKGTNRIGVSLTSSEKGNRPSSMHNQQKPTDSKQKKKKKAKLNSVA
jgi:hypothetical protein